MINHFFIHYLIILSHSPPFKQKGVLCAQGHKSDCGQQNFSLPRFNPAAPVNSAEFPVVFPDLFVFIFKNIECARENTKKGTGHG
jgi:hypothetical protein